jgi:PAS domain-containing protein
MDIIYPLSGGHCLFTSVTLNHLWKKITSTRIASTGYAFMVDKEGIVLAHPDPTFSNGKLNASDLPVVKQVMSAVAVGSTEYMHPKTHKEIVGAYAPVEDLGWGIIIQQDKQEVYVSVYRMQQQATLEVIGLLNTLPFDITFVDKDGTVKYYSQGKERIFPRTKAVIGRKVTNCHPPASVHIVEKVVADLMSGVKEHEDFWIRMGEKYVLIRYYAVRDEKGEYLGTLEVTQDIAPIQAIQGEKRLMTD